MVGITSGLLDCPFKRAWTSRHGEDDAVHYWPAETAVETQIPQTRITVAIGSRFRTALMAFYPKSGLRAMKPPLDHARQQRHRPFLWRTRRRARVHARFTPPTLTDTMFVDAN